MSIVRAIWLAVVVVLLAAAGGLALLAQGRDGTPYGYLAGLLVTLAALVAGAGLLAISVRADATARDNGTAGTSAGDKRDN